MVYDIIVVSLLLFFFYKFFLINIIGEGLFIYDIRKNGVLTEGKIIDMEEFVDSDNVKTYRPRVEFLAEDGLQYLFSPKSVNSIKPRLGQGVRVFYKKGKPDIAITDSLLDRAVILFRLLVYVAGFSVTVYFVITYLNKFLNRN
jgi:hypothetical protein